MSFSNTTTWLWQGTTNVSISPNSTITPKIFFILTFLFKFKNSPCLPPLWGGSGRGFLIRQRLRAVRRHNQATRVLLKISRRQSALSVLFKNVVPHNTLNKVHGNTLNVPVILIVIQHLRPVAHSNAQCACTQEYRNLPVVRIQGVNVTSNLPPRGTLRCRRRRSVFNRSRRHQRIACVCPQSPSLHIRVNRRAANVRLSSVRERALRQTLRKVRTLVLVLKLRIPLQMPPLAVPCKNREECKPVLKQNRRNLFPRRFLHNVQNKVNRKSFRRFIIQTVYPRLNLRFVC